MPRRPSTEEWIALLSEFEQSGQAILEHLRLPSSPLPLAPATSPPQLAFW